ncbi:MAG: GSCFA domain-containing protein [Magnetococcales bacterium]|nr:GSCFA domain-containing protein [Magnetococcales bacterium]
MDNMLKTAKIVVDVNDRWRQFFAERAITIKSFPIVERDDVVFTMGSCFAREIRYKLAEAGIRVGPDFSSIPDRRDCYVIDNLPHEQHLNYYNTFTMRQEFECIVGKWTQSPTDYWQLKRDPTGLGMHFQDPYKRMTFAKTPEELHAAISQVNDALARAARTSRIFFFTLGMAEVFKKLDNQLIACQKPSYLGGGGELQTQIHLSSFAENLDNMNAIREIIKSFNPDARIVVSVSPVPLERTFSERDILVANLEGKSLLRAVAGEFARSHEDVAYFPSYEIVTMLGEAAFEARDLRHVNAQTIHEIMTIFFKAHFVP